MVCRLIHCTNRQRLRNARAREQLLVCKPLAALMGWLSESGRKLLLSMPAWRGMVTFRRSSDCEHWRELRWQVRGGESSSGQRSLNQLLGAEMSLSEDEILEAHQF